MWPQPGQTWEVAVGPENRCLPFYHHKFIEKLAHFWCLLLRVARLKSVGNLGEIEGTTGPGVGTHLADEDVGDVVLRRPVAQRESDLLLDARPLQSHLLQHTT